MLSHQLIKSDPTFAKDIWDNLKKIKDSKEFQEKLEKYIKGEN